jgi:hypothetical protein
MKVPQIPRIWICMIYLEGVLENRPQQALKNLAAG